LDLPSCVVSGERSDQGHHRMILYDQNAANRGGAAH
jgi:hypothetical protein